MPTSSLRSIAVYCGSSPGRDRAFATAASTLGRLLAERGLRLVYGGGHVGLMGAVADGALGGGGEVVGVITEALAARELSHEGLERLEVVTTMHERKARMADLADAVIMLPGGFGTLEELLEMITWQQLGLHTKPVGVLDTAGFYGPMLSFFDAAVEAGFISPASRRIVCAAATPTALLATLADHVPPPPVVPPSELPPVSVDVLN